VLQGGPGVERDSAVVAGVVGFQRAVRELPSAPVERIRAEGIRHADEASAAVRYQYR
jgi:hypothetical protein